MAMHFAPAQSSEIRAAKAALGRLLNSLDGRYLEAQSRDTALIAGIAPVLDRLTAKNAIGRELALGTGSIELPPGIDDPGGIVLAPKLCSLGSLRGLVALMAGAGFSLTLSGIDATGAASAFISQTPSEVARAVESLKGGAAALFARITDESAQSELFTKCQAWLLQLPEATQLGISELAPNPVISPIFGLDCETIRGSRPLPITASFSPALATAGLALTEAGLNTVIDSKKGLLVMPGVRK